MVFFRPFVCILFIGSILTALSPPTINTGGVVSAATYFPSWHPQSGIAQGSIFAIFGTGLATDQLAVATQFPVPTELGGTSVDIMAGGGVFSCPIVFTSANQVAAIAP